MKLFGDFIVHFYIAVGIETGLYHFVNTAQVRWKPVLFFR